MLPKNILLTGHSYGIGKELAILLANDGHTIIGLSRSKPDYAHKNIKSFTCDLTQIDDLISTIITVSKEFKQLDALINNAAALKNSPLPLLSHKDIDDMIQLNFSAVMHLTREVFSLMLRKRSGRIINVVSMASQLNVPGDSVYAATKAGIETFSKIINKEGHRYNITSNCIGVSAVETGMLADIISKTPDQLKEIIPHRAFADIDSIYNLINLYLDEKSHDIGGQNIFLGGV
ncbi:MAG: SDR family oxidoreductase [Gammaproteobacteria bacterium]|jgi:short-subunit dehydrogenase|nr:SDR family oxidoreductase [Gammaproteobacteria bacterium]|tara:strand:+ start:2538 stop:3236 length:699 start_codon:yes stop_codon:yes gene_type:complete